MHLLEFIVIHSSLQSLAFLALTLAGLNRVYYEKQLQEEILCDPFSNPRRERA